MKIVDVCAFYSERGGGVRTYIERKLAAGPRLGHEIVILAPGRESRIEYRSEQARIVYIPAPKFPLDKNYRYFGDIEVLHRALDHERPDFVEASSPWRSAEMVARWQGAAPRALIMHADPLAAYAYRWFQPLASQPLIDRGFGWFWRHLLRLDQSFDTIISANSSLSQRLIDGGLRGVRTEPMGVEPGIFDPAHRDEALRTGLLSLCSLGPDAVLLIGIGRHAPEKRWPMVIDACVAAGYDRPVGLLLIGAGREGAKVRRVIRGNPHIQLLRPLENRNTLARVLASADALIHGCESETFCLVAAEARASGLPIIVPDRGGAYDQVLRGEGESYSAGSAAAAAAAISRLVDGDFAACRARAAIQAQTVRTMDQHFAALFGHYEMLTSSVRRAA